MSDSALAGMVGLIVGTVLSGVTLFVLLPLAIVACCSIHRKGDPLRTPFVGLLYSANIVTIFYLVFVTAYRAVDTYLTYDNSYYYNDYGYLYVNYLAYIFQVLAGSLISLLLVELGTALWKQQSGYHKAHTVMVVAARLLSGLILVLGIAVFAKLVQSLSSHSGDYSTWFLDVDLAISIFQWLYALGIFSLAVLLRVKIAPSKLTTIYLAASTIFLMCQFYVFIIAVRSYQGDEFPENEYYSLRVTYPIFAYWTLAIVLALVTVIGMKKVGGLWTDGHMGGAGQHPVVYGPAGYGVNGYNQGGYFVPQPQQVPQQQQIPQNGYYPPPMQNYAPPTQNFAPANPQEANQPTAEMQDNSQPKQWNQQP